MNINNKTIYDFTLILSSQPELTEELCDALFAAGCDDATSGQICGSPQMMFHREAESLESAIRSAIADIQKVGCHVERLEMDNESLTQVAGGA